MKVRFLLCSCIRTFILLVVAAAITGCGGICDSENLDFENGLEDDVFLSAKVVNSSEFNSTVKVNLMMYGYYPYREVELASGVWKDGSFAMEFPERLDTKYLHPLISGDWLISAFGGTAFPVFAPLTVIVAFSNITISNENVKIVDAQFSGVDKDGNKSGIFSLDNADGDWPANDFSTKAIFTYVDSDVNISGKGYIKSSGFIVERTTTYSIKWKKGWNVWYRSVSYKTNSDSMIITEQWSSTPVSGLKWFGNSSVN